MKYDEFIKGINEYVEKVNAMEGVEAAEFVKAAISSKSSQDIFQDLQEVIVRAFKKLPSEMTKEEEKKMWASVSVGQPYFKTFYKLHVKFETMIKNELGLENKQVKWNKLGLQVLDYSMAKYKTERAIDKMVKRMAKENQDFLKNCPRLYSKMNEVLKEEEN